MGLMFFTPILNPPRGTNLLILSDSDFNALMDQLRDEPWMRLSGVFYAAARITGLPQKIRPGSYNMDDTKSLFSLLRKLRAGKRSEVRFVITKFRTKEDLAGKIGSQFEADSAETIRFLLSPDSLRQYGVDTHTVMTMIIPNSYLCWWNGPTRKIMDRMHQQSQLFWKGKRGEKAKNLDLSPIEVYILASIVEEETTRSTDKGKIARVYMNRLKKGMRLEADPTVKYALRQFGLTRIYHGHLETESPYNTYFKSGLPPGPICTPSIETIEAVLDAPPTDHLFFVAKPDFSGYSNFASTYPEHLKYARQYQEALNKLQARQQP
jgi:UPF0755 protein